MRTAARGLALCVALLGTSLGGGTRADEACTDFKWDVTQERALFRATPTTIQAGTDADTAPAVVPNKLYEVKLSPKTAVHFAAQPGKPGADDASAGLAILKIPAAGNYRVSLDLPVWVDVVANDNLVPAKDFQGQKGCASPHKIVEFELLVTKPFLIQLNGARAGSVLMAITASPARVL